MLAHCIPAWVPWADRWAKPKQSSRKRREMLAGQQQLVLLSRPTSWPWRQGSVPRLESYEKRYWTLAWSPSTNKRRRSVSAAAQHGLCWRAPIRGPACRPRRSSGCWIRRRCRQEHGTSSKIISNENPPGLTAIASIGCECSALSSTWRLIRIGDACHEIQTTGNSDGIGVLLEGNKKSPISAAEKYARDNPASVWSGRAVPDLAWGIIPCVVVSRSASPNDGISAGRAGRDNERNGAAIWTCVSPATLFLLLSTLLSTCGSRTPIAGLRTSATNCQTEFYACPLCTEYAEKELIRHRQIIDLDETSKRNSLVKLKR